MTQKLQNPYGLRMCMLVQERIRIPDDKMDYYKDLAEMYVGDDVSPDFYGWVFPKYDHVAVGTGTVVNKPGIKQYQQVCQQHCRSVVFLSSLLPVTLMSWQIANTASVLQQLGVGAHQGAVIYRSITISLGTQTPSVRNSFESAASS